MLCYVSNCFVLFVYLWLSGFSSPISPFIRLSNPEYTCSSQTWLNGKINILRSYELQDLCTAEQLSYIPSTHSFSSNLKGTFEIGIHIHAIFSTEQCTLMGTCNMPFYYMTVAFLGEGEFQLSCTQPKSWNVVLCSIWPRHNNSPPQCSRQ